MINKIGRFVFFEACKEIKKWHDLGYYNLSISINVSAKQLEDSSFLIFVYDVLKKIDIDPKYINIEITERVLVSPTNNILNMLMAFRSKGIKIFIDDFGTKYSSLNYLYCFPIDGIKIDKSFIDNIHNSDKEFIIIKNIIRLAHELEIQVVAEGVEKKEQLECLKNINCNKIQGFFFGKPVNSNEFINYLKVFNR
jgi:diguanylate cyclase